MRRTDGRLRLRVPLAGGDLELLPVQHHLEVVCGKGHGALREHVTTAAARLVVAVGRSAALGDDRPVRVLRMEEDLQEPPCDGPNRVEARTHPAAVDVELREGRAKGVVLDEQVEREVLGGERVVHPVVDTLEVGLLSVGALYVRVARNPRRRGRRGGRGW
eukprot:2361554-Prymnesium_polylepis.4